MLSHVDGVSDPDNSGPNKVVNPVTRILYVDWVLIPDLLIHCWPSKPFKLVFSLHIVRHVTLISWLLSSQLLQVSLRCRTLILLATLTGGCVLNEGLLLLYEHYCLPCAAQLQLRCSAVPAVPEWFGLTQLILCAGLAGLTPLACCHL